MLTRLEALREIVAVFPDAPTVATCGLTSRELASLGPRDNHLYALNSMGLAPAIGAGLALGGPTSDAVKIVVIEGDGGLLMGLGTLATIGLLQPGNLVLVLLDNAVHASTGFQPTASATVDLGAIAEAAGLTVLRSDDQQSLRSELERAKDEPGPILVHVRTVPTAEAGIGYLQDDPAVIAARFQRWLRTATASTADAEPV